MAGPASSTITKIYMPAHEQTAISTTIQLPKVWERFVDVYSIVNRTHLETIFHHINNLHQNIKFTIQEESNVELAFLNTLLKHNNGKISVLVYRKPKHKQYLELTNNITNNYSSNNQTNYKESVIPCLMEHLVQ